MKTIFSLALTLLLLSNTLSASASSQENHRTSKFDFLNSKTFLQQTRLIRPCFFKKSCHRKCRVCPPGPPGPPGPAFSTSAASFALEFSSLGAFVTLPGDNIPFNTTFFSPIGITYDVTNNNFSFSQSGIYLVSYGVSLNTTGEPIDRFVSLFYNNDPIGGTQIPGTQFFINVDSNLIGTTIAIPITTSQKLSLVNSGPDNIDFSPANSMVAYITITRIADLP